MSRTSVILDILNCKSLHLQLVGELPKEYSNKATHSFKCFIGGSYALYVAAKILDKYWDGLTYNDIDVYINDVEDCVREEGKKYQNIVLSTDEFGKISVKCASLVVNMYDLTCCQFFIYNGLVFGTSDAIKSLDTRSFTVMKQFMGCIQTRERVDKYRERGFRIKTPKPDKILSLNYYGTTQQNGPDIISYPRSFSETLYHVFGIRNKEVVSPTIVPEYPELNLESAHNILCAILIKKNRKYFDTAYRINKADWIRINGVPMVEYYNFELSDLHITDNVIIMEFTSHDTQVVYVIDKNTYEAYYTMNHVRYHRKKGVIKHWMNKLPYLGIAFNESGIFIMDKRSK